MHRSFHWEKCSNDFLAGKDCLSKFLIISGNERRLMMASNLMRFDPFGDIARAEPFHNIEDLFKDFGMFPTLRNLESQQRIRMDVSETDDAYMVKAEMPGVKKRMTSRSPLMAIKFPLVQR
ncbi:hypothetical protein ACFS07_07755 [Undibacterium arcticum]